MKSPFIILLCFALAGSIAAQTNGSSTQSAADQHSTSSVVAPDSTKLEVLNHPFTYPDEAREKGIQGQVIVRVTVSTTGDVTTAEPVSGDPILLKAAVDAIKTWKFKPYIKNGKPVNVTANLPLNFNLPQAPSGPITVPSGVAQGHLIHRVAPVYPPIAQAAHISGFVHLSAVIGKDGKVSNLKVISGAPLLISAAIDAVKQWRYSPYMQNGEPVEVQTEITVIFSF